MNEEKTILEVFGEKSKDGDELKSLINTIDAFSRNRPKGMPMFPKSPDFGNKVDAWSIRDMVKRSKEPGMPFQIGGLYDLEGRLKEAGLPKKYSFDEMNYPLGSPGAADWNINIMDVLDQRDIANFLTDKGQQSANLTEGVKREDMDKTLGALDKLNYMIGHSLHAKPGEGRPK